jgi:hypothetical protein
MESCVQSQGEEEEIELISLQSPQPQRPFSSLRLLLRSTPAFLLLVIILLLPILNSQGEKKKRALLPHLLCALYPTSFAFVHPEGENGGRGGLYLARVHTDTHTNSISSSKNIAPFFTDTAIHDWRSRSADAQLSLQQSAIVWR